MIEEYKKESKFLSYVLRHKPEDLSLTMDINGWVSVHELIKESKQSKYKFTLFILDKIVETDNKGRYEFNDTKTKIRARQGHSIQHVQLDFKDYIPTSILYHGTSKDNYKKIIKSGSILPMGRNKVHLSKDLDTASNVGSRHGDLKIIVIDAIKLHDDGYKFQVSNNNVILADNIPTKYFIHGDNNGNKDF